jgi:hypothetical protein
MKKVLRVLKPTDENWYPSFRLNGWYKGTEGALFLEVSLLNCHSTAFPGDFWRVCVWGADDFGMEKDFYEYKLAQATFLRVIGEDKITTDFLKSLNFGRV